MTNTALIDPARSNTFTPRRTAISRRLFALAIVTLAILTGILALGILPAHADAKLNTGGCSNEVATGAAAKACIDKGVSDGVNRTIMCTISGNYCCKQSSSGYISGCTSLRANYKWPNMSLPTQNELPPRTLVTPIIGGTAPPAGLKAVGVP